MSDARTEILARIRTALADRPAVAAAPPPQLMGRGSPDRFAERVADYQATVARAADDAAVRALVADACSRQGAQRIAVPDGVPGAWVPDGIEVAPVRGEPDIGELDAVDGVLTSCATAIAETGTIVLDGGPGQGPRAATLLPDLHICVVPGDRIVAGVPDAIAHLAAGIGRAVTFISGPSATSDIELDRVEGVHGPRRLEVIVAGPS